MQFTGLDNTCSRSFSGVVRAEDGGVAQRLPYGTYEVAWLTPDGESAHEVVTLDRERVEVELHIERER